MMIFWVVIMSGFTGQSSIGGGKGKGEIGGDGVIRKLEATAGGDEAL